MPSTARAVKQNPGRTSPAKGRKSASPAKSSRGREGLKLPSAFKDLGPIASGAFSTIIKARHIESGTIVAVKAFKCRSDEEAAERDRELGVLRLVSEVGHARELSCLNPRNSVRVLEASDPFFFLNAMHPQILPISLTRIKLKEACSRTCYSVAAAASMRI